LFYDVSRVIGKDCFHNPAPELLVKAQELATREHRTMSELFREALRRYMRADAEWEGVLARTRAQARALGVMNEDDVERLSDEYRLTPKASMEKRDRR
jgi:hypothetical protein